MIANIGDKVIAIFEADKEEVKSFGTGVLCEREVPPENVLMFGLPVKHPNPKIKLDSGKVVFGCECWWGSEKVVLEKIGSRKIVLVDIDEIRAASNQKKGEENE